MILALGLAGLALFAAQLGGPPDPNRLTSLERRAGWRLLFDGESAKGWVGYCDETEFRDKVEVRDGWLFPPPGKGCNLALVEKLGEFDLECEWRARADDEIRMLRLHARADAGPQAEADPLVLFTSDVRGRGLVLRGGTPGLAFRLIRVRESLRIPGEEVRLVDGKSLAGWRALGDARYAPVDDGILGEVGGGGQSFLVTERSFGDFILDVDVTNELPGNSGIQVRSHVNEKGRLFGYQIEIDPSERAWSGGLYDEGRRGWLQDLSKNEAGRKAFVPGKTNHYRIECVGPWIRAWVNGVPTADCFDPLDLEGVIGLQVHSGKNTRVRWTSFRLLDLGRQEWKPLALSELRIDPPGQWKCSASRWGDFSLRFRFDLLIGAQELRFRSASPLDVKPDDRIRAFGGGLAVTRTGWTLDFGALVRASKALMIETHELALTCYGPRIDLFLDGRPIVRVNETEGPRSGMIGIRIPAALVEGTPFEDVQVLGEPVR